MLVERKKVVDKLKVGNLSAVLGVQPLTAELLVARGYDSAELARNFLSPKLSDLPDFNLYSGVKEGVERIRRAVDYGEKVVIYGDYDCDGVCATAILYQTLTSLGVDVSVYIPKRLEEGYGLTKDTLEKVAEEFFPDLIITVDCGISSFEEVEYCINELGIDILVTDHHEIPNDVPQTIVINPHMDAEKGYFVDFCGAGVAFMLVTALCGLEFASNYVDVAAIATMGDIVSLNGSNRIIVTYGIKKLMKSPCVGLKQLMDDLGIKGDITGYDLSFKIVPRINSLGRLGDATRAIALFTESDYFVLSCLIKEMNEENAQRQSICEKIEEEALILARNIINTYKAIVLYGNWHKGVLGITASKLAERFHRPVILFCLEDGILRGSCRSIEGINIYEVLCKFEKRFLRFGGHSQAAGITMEVSEFNVFRDEFCEYIEQTYPDSVFMPSYSYDVDITNVNITREFLCELKKFEPFGYANPKPIFYAVEEQCNFQYGKNNPIHISAQTKRGYSISGFFKGELLPLLNSTAKKDCLYSLGLNVFNGREYSQAVLEKIVVREFPKNVNEELEIENFAKTARFNQTDAEVFEKSELSRIIIDEFKDNHYGNLVVCFTLSSYFEVKKLLNENQIEFMEYYHAPTLKDTVNAVVYCPSDKFDYKIFANVYFFDKPLGYPKEEGFEVYSNADECKLLDVVTNLGLDRKTVGDWFLKIKYALSFNKLKTIDAVMHVLSVEERDRVKFLLCWQILVDVGLIEKNREDNVFILINIRTELTKSKLYCIMN